MTHSLHAGAPAGRIDIPLSELRFRRLTRPEAFDRVRHLREEIRLPAAVLSDPGFEAREKKRRNGGGRGV